MFAKSWLKKTYITSDFIYYRYSKIKVSTEGGLDKIEEADSEQLTKYEGCIRNQCLFFVVLFMGSVYSWASYLCITL